MILYISTNDGSDMRINKEVRTLSSAAPVVFIGIGDPSNAFLKNYCKEVILTKGAKSSISTWIKFFISVWKVVLTRKIKSVHLINEELLLLFYPICILKYTVADIFDSLFLRKSIPLFLRTPLMFITYLPLNLVIVTDTVRKGLMPRFLQKRIIVLENFPAKPDFTPIKKDKDKDTLHIIFYGWLGKYRGGSFVKDLLDVNLPVKIYMAGWFSDDFCKQLIEDPKVTYWGVISQKEALLKASEFGDYILCMYAPINRNNQYASPNKIYDAVQIGVPVIINQEVKVSEMVRENNLGLVLECYETKDIHKVFNDLQQQKSSFEISKELASHYLWENIEHRLKNAHRL